MTRPYPVHRKGAVKSLRLAGSNPAGGTSWTKSARHEGTGYEPGTMSHRGPALG